MSWKDIGGRGEYFLTTVTLGRAARRLETALAGVRESATTSIFPILESVSTTATPVFPVAPETTILIFFVKC